MKTVFFGILIFSVSASFVSSDAHAAVNTTYWRIASYPTWTGSLQQYHYDTFNMFFHFNMEPQSDGTLGYGGVENAQNAMNEIAKAHAQNDLMLLVIGGWGYGPQFQGATSDANRAKFVSEITNRVHTLGYDGITFDWEDGVNNPNLIKTMQALRTEFNKLNPKPLLLIDVCCDVTTDSIKQVEPYVDSINTMDYTTGVAADFNDLVSAGIPASKIINGLGFYSYVNSAERATSEVQFAIDHGMKGIEVWDSGEITGASDPRTAVIRQLLGTGPASLPGNNIAPVLNNSAPAPDNTAPVLSNGQPTGTIKSTSATLSVSTNEAATCKYNTTAGTPYDSMASSATPSGTSHSWPLSGLSDGIKNYYVKCKDSLGNRNAYDYPISFAVSLPDTISPSISISAPSDGQIVTTPSITISGTASDNAAIRRISVKIGTGKWQAVSGTASWSKTITLSPGSNTITVRATDTSGNVKTASVAVTYKAATFNISNNALPSRLITTNTTSPVRSASVPTATGAVYPQKWVYVSRV